MSKSKRNRKKVRPVETDVQAEVAQADETMPAETEEAVVQTAETTETPEVQAEVQAEETPEVQFDLFDLDLNEIETEIEGVEQNLRANVLLRGLYDTKEGKDELFAHPEIDVTKVLKTKRVVRIKVKGNELAVIEVPDGKPKVVLFRLDAGGVKWVLERFRSAETHAETTLDGRTAIVGVTKNGRKFLGWVGPRSKSGQRAQSKSGKTSDTIRFKMLASEFLEILKTIQEQKQANN